MKEVLTNSQLCTLMRAITDYSSDSDNLKVYKDKINKLIDEELVNARQAYQLGLLIGMTGLKISILK